ncbi:ATP-binding cassette domain-containing protein [Actinomyces procaprae]|uniref:ATP-binding cassette domain-containing protein n=1 Tax=Actinomyces procaprae TaxID=2560010 RepID=UPI00109DD442|nr:ATP-binding cassette domain-containing protein [Actinomyces procaprae]
MSERQNVILDRMGFAYGGAGERVIYRGVTCRLAAGRLHAVMGPSGSGKTTLFRLITGELEPDTGTIELAGTGGARRVSQVYQDYRLVPYLTAVENVKLAQEFASAGGGVGTFPDAAALLGRLGLAGQADAAVSSLSGGEQQRVAIARALATAPQVLLADEPTGAVDEQATREIAQRFADLAHDDGLLVLVATHDPVVAEYADVVLRIHDHDLVAEPSSVGAMTGGAQR